MHQRHYRRALTALALAGAAMLGVACSDEDLAVTNPNAPDVARVYGNPRDVEAIVSKLFQQMYNGQYGTPDDIWTQTMTMSFESSSTAGNFEMGNRGAIPRGGISNQIGGNNGGGNFRDFDFLSRNARSAANAIAAFDAFLASNNTTGSPARDQRARAFAWFALGYAHGQLAMLYDSLAVIEPTTPTDPIPPLVVASEAVNYAYVALDSAIAIAGRLASLSGAADEKAFPADWLADPAGAAVAPARLQQIARSLKARYRAGVARNPEQRNAVDWQAVVADATNGITSDWRVQLSTTAGWSSSVLQQLALATNWSQMTPMILGMADTSGGYQAWLAQPLMQRTPFLLKTPDKRFPSGETRAEQVAVSGGTSRAGTAPGSILYFRARPQEEDQQAEPWGTWYYDNHRFWGIRANSGTGPFVIMSLVENDMLAAEGHIRRNNFAAAAALIDKSRVRAGLPSVAGITNNTTPVPGGNACVPRVPTGNGAQTACGNLFEAMKWEKRVETSFTGYAQWFIDSRGWGDLWPGTPLEWPVPYQELLARQMPLYTSEARAAGPNTYGFGS